MESVILALIKHILVSTATREIGEIDKKLWIVLKHYSDELLPTRNFSDVRNIGIDEYSHRDHNYISVVLSYPTDKHAKVRVLDIADSKGNTAVSDSVKLFHNWEEKQKKFGISQVT